MSDASFYSQSSNFISAVQGGVDPRTGLYTFTLPLAKLQGNSLAGPSLALTLNYSPLSAVDIGFGIGVGINLSTYDTSNFQLSLSSGEKYYTDSDGTIRQRKLNNVNLTPQDDGWLLTHKSGQTEHLVSYHDTLFVTDTITAPDGRALHIAWNDDLVSPCPSQVTDDDGTVLLSVTCDDSRSSTVVTVWPGTAAEFSWTLGFENAFLTSLTNNGSTPAMQWALNYDTIGSSSALNVLTSLQTPTGLTESVAYYSEEDDWMQFPAAAQTPSGEPMPPLPCVQYFTLSPGNGQSDMVTQYNYTQKNYLGKDGGFNEWQPDSDCMLGYLLEDYLYGSTAEQLDSDGKTVLVTTTRRYNNYHLLVSEETSQGSGNDLRTYLKETAYFAVPGDDFDAQPAQYQCPKTVTETWTDASKPDGQQTRQEIQTCAFDESGNPTEHGASDGTVTAWEYYPAEGDGKNCPADPYGFVRFIKTKTVTPPNKQGDELTQQTTYTYLKLAALTQGYAVLPAGSVYTCGKVSQTSTKQYSTDNSTPLQYGRLVKKQTVRMPDVSHPSVTYTSTEAYQFSLDGTNLVQKSTFTGHDNLSASTTKKHDIRTGKLMFQTDAQQNTVDYTYDNLERIVSRTLNKGTAYENTLCYAYSLASKTSSVTDVFGNTTTQYHDSLGRKQRTTLTPSGLSEVEINRGVYNVLGQLLSVTETDPRDTAGVADGPSTMTANMAYDNWGQNTQTAFSDKTCNVHLLDPVTLQRMQQEEGGSSSLLTGTAQKSGRQVTQYDAQLKVPVSETLYDASGSKLGSSQSEYDGMKRLRKHTDILGNVTTWNYDEAGRVLKQVLPDGSCVEKTYAPHSAHALVASITVTPDGQSPVMLGTQDFDSLARVKSSTSGGRITTYHYEGCQPHPVKVTAPDGQVVDYTYTPQLGNSLAQLQAPDVQQKFDYDVTTGLLQQGGVDGGLTVKLEHNPLGQLISETRVIPDTQQQNKATYRATVRNTPVSYTDVTGAQQTYGYDEHGRFILCDDPDIRVDMTYDSLGRLHIQKTTSKNDDGMVTLTLAYDDFHREISRRLADKKGTLVMQLESEWYANGQLKQETRSDASGVVSQTGYVYDNRSRLTDWTCTGSVRPVDAYGQTLLRQQFTFDALNNLTQCVTTFGESDKPEIDTATFVFGNPADPTQLTAVTHTHKAYPASISLKYDSNGRMTQDEAGRQLSYDSLGRLQALSGGGTPGGNYTYDAFDVLCQQQVNDDAGTAYELYYRGHDLVCEKLPASKKNHRFMRMNGQSLGMTTKAQQ